MDGPSPSCDRRVTRNLFGLALRHAGSRHAASPRFPFSEHRASTLRSNRAVPDVAKPSALSSWNVEYVFTWEWPRSEIHYSYLKYSKNLESGFHHLPDCKGLLMRVRSQCGNGTRRSFATKLAGGKLFRLPTGLLLPFRSKKESPAAMHRTRLNLSGTAKRFLMISTILFGMIQRAPTGLQLTVE